MAGVNAEAVLEKISQGHLECPICRCRFDKPKILNCLHSFCQKCLEEMVEGHPNQTQITCPICRQTTVLPEAGITGILNNFSLMALVDEVTQQEELVKSQTSKVICEECDEKAVANSWCLECREYLCEVCENAHKRSKKTKSHEVAAIGDLRSGRVSFASRLWNDVPKCEKHSLQDRIFYCKTCMSLVCVACTVLDHKAPDHEVSDISEAIDYCKGKVSELVEETQQCLTEFKAAKNKTLKSYSKHQNMTSQKHSIVTQKAEVVMARIRRNEHRLKEKISELCSKRDQKFEEVLAQHEENVKETENALERVENVMAHAGKFDLLTLQQNLLQNLNDVKKRHIPPKMWGLTLEDFKQCDNFSPEELDILFVAQPLPAPEQAKMMKVGTRVVRGPDWEWGNQDGYPPGEGEISQELNREGWVTVKWVRHQTRQLNYRMGAEGKYDLQLAKQKTSDKSLDEVY